MRIYVEDEEGNRLIVKQIETIDRNTDTIILRTHCNLNENERKELQETYAREILYASSGRQ